jgi:hypothetical protein
VIDSENWGSQDISEFDNEANWAVTQNAADAAYNPGTFNYVVWTQIAEDGSWWTCTVAFGIDSLEMALATENTSDDSDPANSGCGDFGWTQMTPRSPIEVAGVWNDNFGGWTAIDWTMWGANTIRQYDNEANWAVVQNSAENEWNPEKFSYVVWTEAVDDGSWWMCAVAFGLDTIEEALAVENTSDDSDPANSGCGDFAWTQMTPRDIIEVAGSWADNFGGGKEITAMYWGSSRIKNYDNAENWVVTQSPADDEFSPSQFSYTVWTDAAQDGNWWTCTVAFGLETIEEALATENTSDDSDPANSGCGDFSWTQMSPRP